MTVIDDRISPQDGDFPGDDHPIPTLFDASEFRDIDITGQSRTTDFGSLDNESLRIPERVQPRVSRAALTNDGREIVPVEITQPVAARSFDSYSIVLSPGAGVYPGDAVRLAGEDPERMRILISTSGTVRTDIVLVGPIGSVSNGAGFGLAQGIVFETKVQGAIYACVPTGGVNPVTVHVWIERGL